jgi:hypothetical protein
VIGNRCRTGATASQEMVPKAAPLLEVLKPNGRRLCGARLPPRRSLTLTGISQSNVGFQPIPVIEASYIRFLA